MARPTRFILASTVLALAGVATAAHADCIPISSVPYTISQSGSYCVTADLSIDLTNGGVGIYISTSHVDLDFQGHSLKNTSTTAENIDIAAYGVAVYVPDPVMTDVMIHNGTVISFPSGIHFNKYNSTIEGSKLTVDHMTVLSSKQVGISVNGTNVSVTNNQVSNTRTVGRWAVGIYVSNSPSSVNASTRVVIQGNHVVNTYAEATTSPASAEGIRVVGFPDILIRDNGVNNTWVKAAAPSGSREVGINIIQLPGVCNQCTSNPVGGLIVQDNNVVNTLIISRQAHPDSTGIAITAPGDHAIISGSSIANMSIGINANNGSWPNTPPVLLLNSTIRGSTTPIIGGVTLPQ